MRRLDLDYQEALFRAYSSRRKRELKQEGKLLFWGFLLLAGFVISVTWALFQ